MINEADESAPRKLGEYTLITDGNTYNDASVSCEWSRGTSQTHTCPHLPPSLCVAPHLFAYNGASASCGSLRAHHRHTPDRDFSISPMDAPIRRVNSRSRTAAHTLVMGGAMSNDARAMVSSSPSSPCSTGSKYRARSCTHSAHAVASFADWSRCLAFPFSSSGGPDAPRGVAPPRAQLNA